MNEGNPTKSQKTSVRWATRSAQTPHPRKRAMGGVTVRRQKMEMWKTRTHIWGRCGGMYREYLLLCVCQTLDQCYIIKIPLSIRAKKVKCVKASSKHSDPPWIHTQTWHKSTKTKSVFTSLSQEWWAFIRIRFENKWDRRFFNNKINTHVILKLQTTTHIHQACAELYTHYVSWNANGWLCNLKVPAVELFVHEEGREMPTMNSYNRSTALHVQLLMTQATSHNLDVNYEINLWLCVC